MTLEPNTAFSHYRILSKIGEGGMGEVYLAEDDILERKVALKILSEQCCKESERLQRFVREAKASSALNHPNIITIFEFGEHKHSHFIASEMIEGVTLASMLGEGPVQPDTALAIASQVASALAAAHSAGIVHRDIKPENVMVRPDGLVKVLDFGVAKLMEHRPARPSGSEDATRIKIDTSPGMIIGTANYMSPEQAAGKAVDHRSDIFSFGVLLYELLAGKLPFSGVTAVEIIGAILYKDPIPLTEAAPELPEEVCRIVAKAMAKDVSDRYQNIDETLTDLRSLQGSGAGLNFRHTEPATRGTEEKTRIMDAAVTGETGAPGDTGVQKASHSTSRTKMRGGPLYALLAVITVAVAGTYWFIPRDQGRQIESIAVMPFSNAGGSPDTEYLSDGLTEALIGALSKLPELSVRSRTSVFRYKGKEIDTKKAGEELGVQTLLSGSVTQRGEDLNVNLELIDTSSDTVIWSERYARKLTDIATLQGEIALAVSRQLKKTLAGPGGDVLEKKPTENSEAYLLYLRGRFHVAKFTREGLNTGLRYFNEAIEEDPAFAGAYAGIAYYYITSADWFLTSRESFPKAKIAAEKALSIDPEDSEAQGLLAIVKWWGDWDPAGAEAAFRKSLEIDPKNAHARAFYGWFLVSVGRTDEGIQQNQEAVNVDPLAIESNSLLGHSFYYSRRYKLAEDQLTKTSEIDNGYWLAHAILARSLYQMGRNEEAIKEARTTLELEGEVVEVRSLLAGILAGSGKTEEARKILADLNELSRTRFVPAYNLAEVYVGLGETDRAMDMLEKAYADRSFFIALLRTDPVFDGLRSEPRFKELQKKTGL